MSVTIPETPFSWKSLLPGSVASICIHALILVLASYSLRGCQKGISGDPGGDVFRDVGLFVVDGQDEGHDEAADSRQTPDSSSDSSTESSSQNSDPISPSETTDLTPDRKTPQLSDVVPQEAPELSDLLGAASPFDSPADVPNDSQMPSLIGPGIPLSGLPAASGGMASAADAASQSARRAAGVVTPGPGETAFMNVTSRGQSFVYLIDISGSMGEDNRLALAKSQLKASLRLLQPTQQFQVIFYSEYPMRMKLRGQSQRAMYSATAANLLWAGREIDAVQPQNGTEHKPALIDAISLQPDVIYFLTDGREPQLSPADMSDIRRMAGKSTIHVIEFGTGGVYDRGESWLQRLARQSKGEYREFPAGR